MPRRLFSNRTSAFLKFRSERAGERAGERGVADGGGADPNGAWLTLSGLTGLFCGAVCRSCCLPHAQTRRLERDTADRGGLSRNKPDRKIRLTPPHPANNCCAW